MSDFFSPEDCQQILEENILDLAPWEEAALDEWLERFADEKDDFRQTETAEKY